MIDLRARGLTPRALAAWIGTDRLSALPALLPRARPRTPASALLELFVAGGTEHGVASSVAIDEPDLIDGSRARVAVLPLGPSLLVCDRLDAPATEPLVCWPDDSSYHLARCVPPVRVDVWRDLACGSAFAQLLRPGGAARLEALDLNPRAVAYAALGARLSGIGHLHASCADIAAAHPPADLVTCNAPMAGSPDPAIWRRADAGFFARLFAAIPPQLAAGGVAIVHAMRAAIPDDLPGERTIVRYAPEFAILRWRPDAPDRLVERERSLTADHPHLTHDDLV